MKFYVLLLKKWEPLHLTLDNSKSEKGQGIIRIKYLKKAIIVQDEESSS